MKRLALLGFVFVAFTYLNAEEWSCYDMRRSINEPLCINIKKLEDPRFLTSTLNKISRAIKRDPRNKLLHSLRFQFGLFLWDVLPPEKKGDFARIAIKWADEEIKYLPDIGDGWAAKGMFLGAYGLSKGPLNVLYFADDEERYLLKAYRLGDRWIRSFAAGLLGLFYFKLPPFPMSIGDIEKARKYLIEAIEMEPGNIYFKIFYAEVLSYTGQIDKAMEIIRSLPDLQPRRWYEKVIYIWTMRTYPTIVEMIKSGIRGKYDKYKYDFLLDPGRHPAHGK